MRVKGRRNKKNNFLFFFIKKNNDFLKRSTFSPPLKNQTGLMQFKKKRLLYIFKMK